MEAIIDFLKNGVAITLYGVLKGVVKKIFKGED